MKFYDYFNPDGSYKIRIIAKSQEHANALFEFAFCGTSLSYDEWRKLA